VLLRGTRITSPPEEFESLAAFERFFSHTHLFDEFRHDIPLIYDQESDSESPDPTHPEFVTAWELAQRIGQMWLAKLERDFPRRRFRIYITKLRDQIVHFHQVRPGEQPWISDSAANDSIARNEMAVFESGPAEVVAAS